MWVNKGKISMSGVKDEMAILIVDVIKRVGKEKDTNNKCKIVRKKDEIRDEK